VKKLCSREECAVVALDVMHMTARRLDRVRGPNCIDLAISFRRQQSLSWLAGMFRSALGVPDDERHFVFWVWSFGKYQLCRFRIFQSD
jgi:hypothetical protein